MPAFRPSIEFVAGVRDTFRAARDAGTFRDSTGDHAYQQLVDEALRAGFEELVA